MPVATPAAEEIKRAAHGRWLEIFTHLGGLSSSLLDGQHHPCPNPSCPEGPGHDRFSAADIAVGWLNCRKCFYERNGDGIAGLQWATGWSFPETCKRLGDYLGINNAQSKRTAMRAFLEAESATIETEPKNIVAEVAKLKRMPLDATLALGAQPGKHGKASVARFPMYGPSGEVCSYFDLGTLPGALSKGLAEKDKPQGLFWISRPLPGETYLLVEGVKDAAALHSVCQSTPELSTWKVAGLPTSKLGEKFTPLFSGCHVIIIPDLDVTGRSAAPVSASRLHGTVASVRIATLPGEVKPKDGDGIREVLQRPNGIDLIRSAIANAKEWAGETEKSDTEWATGIPDDLITNGIANNDSETVEIVPLAMPAILQRIETAANGWPRRVGPRLFTHKQDTDQPIHWLDKPDSLFGWLGYISQSGPPQIYGKLGCHPKGEIFAELQRTAAEYRAIETIPHEPLVRNHYYACSIIEPSQSASNSVATDEFQTPGSIEFDESPTPSKLEQLIDRFSPSSPIDRDLILAMFATAVWGGPGGSRPLFVITSKDGRGVGKSTLAEMLGQLVGGVMAFSPGEELEEVKKRLLSPEGATKRVALIDNLKTHRFSWAEFESLVTAREISGRQMYVGEASRPNILTWVATVNGLAASTDIAQRSVIIYVNRPTHSGDWAEETRLFIDQNQKTILADLIAFLRREQCVLPKSTRWGEWERFVLSRLPEPSEAQRVILDRQKAADVEHEETAVLTEFIHNQIEDLGYTIDQIVFIPSILMSNWFSEATKERHSVTATSRLIKQRIEEGNAPQLLVRPHKGGSRGFVWRSSGFLGENAKFDPEDICENILQQIEHVKEQKFLQKNRGF